MAEALSPITRQVTKENQELWIPSVDYRLEDVEDCLIYDRHGASVPFKKLYQDRKSVIIFVRNFLCYTCKEYVEDLSKIPKEALEISVLEMCAMMQNKLCSTRLGLGKMLETSINPDWQKKIRHSYVCSDEGLIGRKLNNKVKHCIDDADIRLVVIGQSAYHHIEPFCSLTGYPYEIYVDPERCIYQRLGMKREEKFTDSAHPSPHVKSGMFMGQMKSIWRAMTSPAFDFQGDLHQQGGAIIAGPGSQVHFSHFDMNRLDHMPINWLLQLAGVQQTLDFSDKPKIIHV